MKNTQGEVWVFAEQEDGRLSDVPFELLGKARELAAKLGVKVGAVLMGSGVEDLAKPLFDGGADIVHLIDDPALKVFRNKAYRHALVELVKRVNPQIVIFGATHMGRDLAPSVASALSCGLTADCTDLQIGDYEDKKTKETFSNVLMQIRPAFGGNIIATIVNARNWPQMATVREGVMKVVDKDAVRKEKEAAGIQDQIVRHEAMLDGVEIPVEVVDIVRKASGVNLKGARVIVCGGAGVGSKENFALLHDLAAALGGAVGGSRAAVDLGYCEHERQIGQTGVTVRPALMISCGISGAVQHLAGMQDSAKIIAINTDRDAPIFQVAHYGIVGDLNVVIPKLIKAIKAK
ncbi:MAG: electron transfer flavoprotein subunit alpha/FixB family protein [Kiritimatiellae bacterium]|nr:electron transfer flavoprotein subunit alpha/FixB family protein [Kiritimatiellia bacterium]MBO7207578.1 electron transfer flavoprotein subunit alpha/FixB family protein [Kiritimatiellia bacterium]